MRNTLDLLSRWRMALFNIPDAFELLSVLYRNLSATPAELSELTGGSKHEVSKSVRELYKAGLIQIKRGDIFFATEKGSAVMEAEEMLDLAIESLSRELLAESEDSEHRLRWSKHTNAYHDKRDRLFRLQIARSIDQAYGRAHHGTWNRVFKVLTDRQAPSVFMTSNFDDLLAGGTEASADAKSLYRLVKFSEMPENSDLRDVLNRSVMLLCVYWISNPHREYFARYEDNAARCADIFQSWSSISHVEYKQPFRRVLNSCIFDRTFEDPDVTQGKIIFEMKRHRNLPHKVGDIREFDEVARRIQFLLTGSSQDSTTVEADDQSSSSPESSSPDSV